MFTSIVKCNDVGQTFDAIIGAGGSPGAHGGATSCANLSSAAGVRYNGWADIMSGGVYARDGGSAGFSGQDGAIGSPGTPNTGNGGQGGGGGARGVTGRDEEGHSYTKYYPGKGAPRWGGRLRYPADLLRHTPVKEGTHHAESTVYGGGVYRTDGALCEPAR